MVNTITIVGKLFIDLFEDESLKLRDKPVESWHLLQDLDSLDMLDMIFAVERKFNIKMPVEKWMMDINEGRSTSEEYFRLDNFCQKIDEIIAAKVV